MNFYRFTAPDTPIGSVLLRIRFRWQRWGLMLKRQHIAPPCLQLARQLVPQYTMVSLPRLKKLYELGENLAQDGPAGAVVECGVWNGGSSAMIAAGLHARGNSRAFWLFDSFEGLPQPTDKDEIAVQTGYFPGWCTGAVTRVEEAHRLAGGGASPLHIHPGWFEETLPLQGKAIGPIALLHVDADWYESVYTVFQTLYAQVVPGGVVVIDDYGSWRGCRRALEDFFGDSPLLAAQLYSIDGHAVYFTKPSEPAPTTTK